MITDTQYERLPLLFREIVDNRHQLDDLYQLDAVPFKAAVSHIKRGRELARSAAQLYQPGSLRGGPQAYA
jgi:hypothetical protein